MIIYVWDWIFTFNYEFNVWWFGAKTKYLRIVGFWGLGFFSETSKTTKILFTMMTQVIAKRRDDDGAVNGNTWVMKVVRVVPQERVSTVTDLWGMSN